MGICAPCVHVQYAHNRLQHPTQSRPLSHSSTWKKTRIRLDPFTYSATITYIPNSPASESRQIRQAALWLDARRYAALTKVFNHSASALYVRKYPYAWWSTSPYSLNYLGVISVSVRNDAKCDYRYPGPYSHKREECADEERPERRGDRVLEGCLLACRG